MIRRTLLLLLLVFCFGECGIGDWQLEETAHFLIYYERQNGQQLKEIGALAESIHNRLTAVLPNQTFGKTQLVLVDRTDVSNGFATVAPYPKIIIYLSPPQDSFGLGQMEYLEYLPTNTPISYS